MLPGGAELEHKGRERVRLLVAPQRAQLADPSGRGNPNRTRGCAHARRSGPSANSQGCRPANPGRGPRSGCGRGRGPSAAGHGVGAGSAPADRPRASGRRAGLLPPVPAGPVPPAGEHRPRHRARPITLRHAEGGVDQASAGLAGRGLGAVVGQGQAGNEGRGGALLPGVRVPHAVHHVPIGQPVHGAGARRSGVLVQLLHSGRGSG